MAEIKHFGVLGMKWGKRKAQTNTNYSVQKVNTNTDFKSKKTIGPIGKLLGRKQQSPETKAIVDRANQILNNPKSSKKDVDDALASIGVDPKTGRIMKTTPVYDKNGNDISVNPERRLFKAKGQSDKDFDAEFEAEINPKPQKLVGKPVKTLFGTRTEAVYDKDGNDISSKPFGRPFKKKGQSDKDYDKEIDDENSDSPDAIAKRKVDDIQMDKQARVQMGVALATAGVVTVAMYVGKKQLGDAAKASILKKYGPTMAEMIIKSRGL